MRLLVLFAAGPGNTLSYQTGWPAQLVASRRFHARAVNLWRLSWANTVSLAWDLWSGAYDGVAILHSAFSNADFLRKAHRILLRSKGLPTAYFVGNEYKLMPEKMAMCEELKVGLLITMIADERSQDLYRQRLGAKVVCIPSGGVDPVSFNPTRALCEREIDIGYRAFDEPVYFMHNESRLIGDYFQQNGERLGLSTDISMDPTERYEVNDWACFLNRCRGQIGVERGTDVFELTDANRLTVNSLQQDNPATTPAKIWSDLTRSTQRAATGRMLTGRHTEAAACKCVQILFPGRYNDYLVADEHYIPIAKDFSNIDEVVAKFRDDGYCNRMVNSAHELVMSELSYSSLIGRFADAMDVAFGSRRTQRTGGGR